MTNFFETTSDSHNSSTLRATASSIVSADDSSYLHPVDPGTPSNCDTQPDPCPHEHVGDKDSSQDDPEETNDGVFKVHFDVSDFVPKIRVTAKTYPGSLVIVMIKGSRRAEISSPGGSPRAANRFEEEFFLPWGAKLSDITCTLHPNDVLEIQAPVPKSGPEVIFEDQGAVMDVLEHPLKIFRFEESA